MLIFRLVCVIVVGADSVVTSLLRFPKNIPMRGQTTTTKLGTLVRHLKYQYHYHHHHHHHQKQKQRLLTTTNEKSNRKQKWNRRKKRKINNSTCSTTNLSSNDNRVGIAKTATKKRYSLTTTKDRLRLSVPSSSVSLSSRQVKKKNGRRSNNNKNNSNNDTLISSPEEFVQRFNTGVDYARIAVRETYHALRNPTPATNNTNIHQLLLPAREEVIRGGGSESQNGLVMDSNWWFWNLSFAASPSILIFLYCEFIVKPEMKLRYDQQQQEDETTTSTTITTASDDDNDNSDSDSDSNKDKVKASLLLSPMQHRRQQRQHQQRNNETVTSSSSLSSNSVGNTANNYCGHNDNDDTIQQLLWSYFERLVVYLNRKAIPLVPLSQDAHNDGSSSSDSDSKNTLSKEQKQEDQRTTQLETKQQELDKILVRLQNLEDQIDAGGRKLDQQQNDPHSSSSPRPPPHDTNNSCAGCRSSSISTNNDDDNDRNETISSQQGNKWLAFWPSWW